MQRVKQLSPIQRLDILKSYLATVLLASLLFATCGCAVAPKSSERGEIVTAQPVLDDVGGAITPFPRVPVSVSALLRFVELAQGGIIHASVDGATGLPMATVRVESNDSHLPLGLEADGLLVAIEANKSAALPNQVELKWTPWHGNGYYVLNLQLLDQQNDAIPSSQVIIVNVAGISENAPAVKSKFIELYRNRFGLNLTAPVFARYIALDPLAGEISRWVSAAYIGNRLYEIDLFDNGAITSTAYAINSDEGGGFCRPAGTIRLLAVIVDYGNTGLNPADVDTALRSGLEAARKRWVDYSRQLGISEPILNVELTTFVYGAPSQPGQYVTPDEMRARGLNPSSFDLLAEIDLDKNNSVTGQYEGVGVSLGDGCRPGGSRRTNLAFNVTNRKLMQSAMPRSVFEHELMHSLGWMHWWPNKAADGLSFAQSGEGWEPSLMFGWTDTDGDGIIEILDPTPYGLIQ
jgi:hypothetical protein